MIETDPEMLAAFSQEISQIRDELKPVAEVLRTQYLENLPSFEKFGQIIDRIYGTAATFGFEQLAEYCRTLKGINYKCSQTKNSYAIGQVKDLDMVAMALLEKFVPIITDPTKVKQIQYTMQKERERAEEISRKFFATIASASTQR